MRAGKATVTSLVIAALALGSTAVVVLTRDRATTGEKEQRAKNLLPVWREDEVERLELRGKVKVVLARASDDAGEPSWQLVEPLREPADPDAVERLIAALGFAAPIRPSSEPLASAGIDAASPTLVVQLGALRYELRLGKSAEPPSGARYVSLVTQEQPEPRLFVITADTAKLFETSLDELRRRELWPYGPVTLQELVVEGPGVRLDLVKNESASFVHRSGARVSRDAVEPMIAALANLELLRFVDAAAARAALAAGPRFRVRGSARNAPAVELELGGRCPGEPNAVVALRDNGLAGCVDARITERLAPAAETLIDRRPFTFKPDEVEELDLTRDGKRLTLVRKGSGFVLRSPAEAEIGLDAGNARLAAILNAETRIVEQPELARLGLEPAAGKLTITSPGEGKAVQESVSVGKPLPDGRLHLRRADGVVLELDREAARAYAVDTTLLRSLEVSTFAAADLQSLTLGPPLAQRLVRSDAGQLELAEPKGFSVDGALATDLAFELGSLSALRWVSDADDGSFGLDQPVARAELELRSGDAGSKSRTLLVGSPVSGGHYARFSDDPAVFVVARELVEKLQTLLVNRSEFLVDPQAVTRVELSRGAEKVVLAARAGALAALEPAELSPAQMQAITDALSNLRAEAAVHTGAPRPDEGLSRPELVVRVERRGGASRTFAIGAADAWRGQSVVYARVEGVDATFVIARGKLRPLFDAF